MLYVNAYSVQRCYGGPEEGGWWFDAGEPIEGIVLPEGSTQEQIEAAKQQLYEKHGWASKYSRSSVLGDEDFEVYVESQLGTAFPTTRPRYE